jgi:hypothetical protein
MWLYLELANGYKIVVKHALDEGLNPKKDNNLLLAVYRAMEQIVHALVNAYRNSQPPPPLAYLELNQLYQVTAEHGAVDRKVASAKRDTATPSVNNLYKQFMLLAMADPMGLPEGAAFDLFFMLEPFAPLCLVSDTPPPAEARQVYLINFYDDSLPQTLDKADPAQPRSGMTYLDIRPAVQRMEARIAELQKSEQGLMNVQEIRLLRSYVERISGTVERGAVKAARKEVQLAFGLEAAHYFMREDNYVRHQNARRESFGIEVRDVSEDEALYDLEPWQIIETGKTGRLLLVPSSISYQDLELGMPVGVFEQLGDNKPAVYTLGTIRWLAAEDSDEKKIGVQMIAGRPMPVMCAEQQGEDANFECLHLPAVDVLKQPASLLLPASRYAQGKTILIRQTSGMLPIRLGTIIDATELVVQCHYSA